MSSNLSAQVGETVVVQGTWSVDGAILVLENLGRRQGLAFNGRPAVTIEFARDITSPGTAGKSMIMTTVNGSAGLFHELDK